MLNLRNHRLLGAIQPARIAALVVVLLIHGLLGLLLLAPVTTRENKAQARAGESGGIRVYLLARGAGSPPPPPPPPAPAPEPAPAPPQPSVQPSAAAPARPMPAVVPAQDLPSIAAAVVDAGDDGRIPIRTLEPAEIEPSTAGPQVFGADEALPGEFLADVDVQAMERIEFRETNHPIYLEAARQAGHQGIVILKVLVDEVGYPVGIKVMKSSAGEALTQESIRAVSTWRFRPAVKDGLAVKGATLVPIYFFLGGMPPALKQWRSMGGQARSGG